MRKAVDYPKTVKSGSASVKVYRVRHKTAASGFVFIVAWSDSTGRHLPQFTDESLALAEARLKADQLNAGSVAAAGMTASDRDELRAAREIAGSTPILSALREWKEASTLTRGHIIPAAEVWAAKNRIHGKSVTVEVAVKEFISSKDKAGKKGTRTYGAKLKPFVGMFGSRNIETLVAEELEQYLEQFEDGVTRNDFRKRAVALFRWAYKRRYLPQGAPLEIEQTERANEIPSEIGILRLDTWRKALSWTRETNINLLPAVVLAGFCGLRVEEIHGKRDEFERRQIWEDVYLDRGYVRVTTAKTNTPSWRLVPLCPAAIGWLSLCKDREGVVCEYGALWKWRVLARDAGFALPENCLRHSFISYRVALLEGNKQQVATEAGNSVKEIDRRYRVPLLKEHGAKWFSIKP